MGRDRNLRRSRHCDYFFPLSLDITSRRRQSPSSGKLGAGEFTLVVSQEIQGNIHEAAPDHKLVLSPIPEIQIDIEKSKHRVVFFVGLSLRASAESRATSVTETASLEVSHRRCHASGEYGSTRWELEAATNSLADENVIREEGYGIMYVLADNTRVVVKNSSNNRDNTLSKGDFSPLTCIALGIVQAL